MCGVSYVHVHVEHRQAALEVLLSCDVQRAVWERSLWAAGMALRHAPTNETTYTTVCHSMLWTGHLRALIHQITYGFPTLLLAMHPSLSLSLSLFLFYFTYLFCYSPSSQLSVFCLTLCKVEGGGEDIWGYWSIFMINNSNAVHPNPSPQVC